MLKNKTILLLLSASISLSGCLPVLFTAAAGSTMAVAKDRSIGQTVEDIKISAGIKAGLINKGFKTLYTKISVQVLRGRVLLTGDVNTEEEIITAVDVAWAQADIKEVVNELKINSKSNFFNLTQYTKDSLITSQIKSKIFLKRKIKFVNYTIVTMNDIVYIFGIARSKDELDQVSDIAATIRGVEKVISHVIIQEASDENNHSTDNVDDDAS